MRVADLLLEPHAEAPEVAQLPVAVDARIPVREAAREHLIADAFKIGATLRTDQRPALTVARGE